jgi:hypothetical protein
VSATTATGWALDVDPVSVAVECSGELHVVTWRRGKVVLEDHDLGAEEASVALGGPRPACLEVLRLWRNRAMWAVATQPDPPGFVRRRPRPAIPADLVARRELGVVQAWERAAARRPGSDDAEHLYRYLRKRALSSLLGAATAAQARFGGGRVSFVEVRLADADGGDGHRAEVLGRVDAKQTALVVSLTPRWLHDVWARGIGLVDGRFVAAVTDAAAWPAAATVESVDWQRDSHDALAHEPVLRPAELRLTETGYALVA